MMLGVEWIILLLDRFLQRGINEYPKYGRLGGEKGSGKFSVEEGQVVLLVWEI